MAIGAGIDELHRDADFVPRAIDRAFNHGIHTQFLSDISHCFLGAFIPHRRSARDHAEPADLRELGGKFFGHSVRKIVLVRGARKIF